MSLDTKVKNLIINTNMTKEQYEAIDDKSNQLFFVEDSSVVDVPAPEENKSGYLHTDGTNLTWEEIESGDKLPDQTDNAGKFLTTDGTTVSWESAIKNGGDSITGTYNFGGASGMKMTVKEGFAGGIQFFTAQFNQKGPEITANLMGIGVNGVLYNVNGIFAKTVLNSGQLTIPTEAGTLARLEDIPEGTQLETLPVASSDNLNKIYQYTGETSETYTNGYFYKCIETDGVYSWTQVNVQGGGGSGLPDQTDNAGKFLQTDGTTASWADALVNQSPSTQAYAIGDYSTAATYGVAYGSNSSADGIFSVAIGYSAQANADGAIQLGRYGKNNDTNTFKVANYNGNFEMMSADGTIPAERMLKTVDLVDSSVELDINTIYNAGEVASLSITFPTVDVRYTSQLNFTSGATATAFTAPDDIKWDGDSIVKGAFVPEINKRYVILFYYDGINICAIARG